ncbi:MAG: hypothetical protein ACM3QS_07980 [Bacteroidota bacterium]
MKKPTLLFLILFSFVLAACGTAPLTGTVNQTPAGNASVRTLPPLTRLVLGTFKLEGTDQAVTAAQAQELLPLWQVYSSLSQSDTAAQAEVDALVKQIQDTMTAEQTGAIEAMNLTQNDMLTLMQAQGINMGGPRASGAQTAGGSGFGPGGAMPPDGGMPLDGGVPGMGPGSVQRSATPAAGSGQSTGSQARPSLDRVPSPLLTALIDLLKQRAAA